MQLKDIGFQHARKFHISTKGIQHKGRFIAIEQGHPGQILPELCLHSYLQQVVLKENPIVFAYKSARWKHHHGNT